jgi:hypothetical protein
MQNNQRHSCNIRHMFAQIKAKKVQHVSQTVLSLQARISDVLWYILDSSPHKCWHCRDRDV